MPLVAFPAPAVSPLLVAGLLLSAIPHLQRLDLPHPKAIAVVEALGVSRSRAYELREAIEAALPSLLRPAGRPTKPEVPIVDTHPILRACRDFVYGNPGAVGGSGARRHYTDGFRCFVLDLASRHRDVPLSSFGEAAGVPLATLRDWLQGGIIATSKPDNLSTFPSLDPTPPQIETLLALWAAWKGSFVAFCRHANEDWRLPFRRTLIANILSAHGVRFAKRRSGRSPDEDALRGQFESFFPNAQWVGDGSQIVVTLDGDAFRFNLELLVDPSSGAFTGASVSDNEDAQAVIDAVEDAVATTGATPLAVLLDNKPSNHAEEVKEALGDVEIVRATPFRPQNKAHIEGGFGLFSQVAPALAVLTGDRRELARQIVILVVTLWARTLNHRPRKDRGGRSRVELNLDHEPTPDEIAAAQEAIQERIRKQERARQTLAARQDPQVRAALTDAFARFCFADPEGEFLNATARYPLDAVVEAIAVSAGKQRAGTLPAEVDARYLLGIARNISEERENWEIALALWEERRKARDRALHPAERARYKIEEELPDVERRLVRFIDEALSATRTIDRFFWLGVAADAVLDEEPEAHSPLFRLAARRIAARHQVPTRERSAATRFLAARLLPLG